MTDNFVLTRITSELASRNDCTVRAISTLFNAEYDYIALLLKGLGRQDGHGTQQTYSLKLIDALCKSHGATYQRFDLCALGINIRVNEFLRTYNTGSYLCFVKRHVFAVIDGKRFDTYSVNEHVIFGIKFEGAFKNVYACLNLLHVKW